MSFARLARAAVGAGALSLIAAAPLAAQSDPYVLCANGGVSCLALRTAFTSFVSPGEQVATTFSVWVQALQGSWAAPGVPVVDGPWGLTGMSVYRYNGTEWVDPSTPKTYLFVDYSAQKGRPEGRLFVGQGAGFQRDDPNTFEYTNAYFFSGTGQAVGGCGITDGLIPVTDYFTCVKDGDTGWVRFDFGLGLYDFSTGQLAAPSIDDFTLSLEFGGGFCAVNGSTPGCDRYAYPFGPTTTPEPATIALLAPALLGLGGIRRRHSARNSATSPRALRTTEERTVA